MIIRNTSRYPTREVKALVRFATSELDMRRVCVNVKNSSRVRSGYAYDHVPAMSNAPAGCRYLITIKLGGPENWPREEAYHNGNGARRGGRWPEIDIADWREALVHLAAHEGKHIDQYQSRTKCSEVACEHFAAYMLDHYRRPIV